MSNQTLDALIAGLAEEAEHLKEQFAYYWSPEGENVSQLEIFIDPDLYQYIEKMYNDAQSFFSRVAALKEHLAGGEDGPEEA